MSINQFIEEFGENFSDHMKKKLMELESRSFLTRKENFNVFEIKHVEHIQYDCIDDPDNDINQSKKEYVYGQFVVIEGILYFSEECFETNEIIQSPQVSTIYNSLNSEGMILEEGKKLKRIDDSNIDFIIDSILASCPQVSQAYLDIIKGMVSRVKK
jgi:hypothetical protein